MFTIYYDNNTKFTSSDGLPSEAPMDGVQAITQWFPNKNYEIMSGSDYYWWTGDRWVNGNQSALDRWLRTRQSPFIILFGRWTTTSLFEKVMRDIRARK